jgi:hypothetical protein
MGSGEAPSVHSCDGWITIPLCWPDVVGGCGCGRGHQDRAIGKASLVPWERLVSEPFRAAKVGEWRHHWPRANTGVLLEPTGLLVIDVDSAAARCEAEVRGLPPGPTAKPSLSGWVRQSVLQKLL